MSTMLQIQKLSKTFGDNIAVSDLSFSLEPGDVLGFLGPNGAGKSTTMKMITGFLTPTSGQAYVKGLAIDQNPIESKKKMGYLPEGAPLYEDMTPLEFLRFIADVRALSYFERARAIDRTVDQLNLGSVLHQPIETLSKGFKRRVGLAQAILHDPELLILDEPTDGLDPNQKHEVRSLIQDLASQKKAIILSTHILEEVDAVCSRAIIIAGGKMVADSTPQDLRSQFQSESLDELFRILTRGKQAMN